MQTTDNNAEYLDRTIQFLAMTSKIIDSFKDKRPVSNLADHCLMQNQEVLDYLKTWEMDAAEHTELKNLSRENDFCLINLDLIKHQ